MDPRVRQVDGLEMVNEMRQNIEIMLRKKKHAVQVRPGVRGDCMILDRQHGNKQTAEWIDTILKLASTLHCKQNA